MSVSPVLQACMTAYRKEFNEALPLIEFQNVQSIVLEKTVGITLEQLFNKHNLTNDEAIDFTQYMNDEQVVRAEFMLNYLLKCLDNGYSYSAMKTSLATTF